MKLRALVACCLFAVGLTLSFGRNAESRYGGMVQYNRDIRPILSENCFACHGPDVNKRAADLRLDVRDVALEKGAIVPGQPDASELLKRLVSTDPDVIMPPPESHKSLTQQQKDLLKTWIAEGAEYQGHWAFIAPVKPELPQVRNPNWVRNPIDRFILAELERRGMEPSPEADLRSLIRRVCLDLTGLPPTPQEIDRVLADPSPERYENYVDELLSRQEWGEHRGRYWLDYARYADTHGIHFDNYREMWSYREWVIKAFNRNLPFDQFTTEQLAGDLLPNATLDQRIASGFHRCNITTNEGGVIEEEYRVLYARDRVETTGLVWMGLTVGCAVCHDHKFDPITQREFYQMSAFFNNTTQRVMDGNVKDPPPVIPVPLEADRERFLALDGLIAQAQQEVDTRRVQARPGFDTFLADPAKRDEILWQSLPAQDALETYVPFRSNDLKTFAFVQAGQYQQIPLERDAVLAPGQISDAAWHITHDLFPTLPVGDLEKDQSFSVALWVKPGNDKQGGSLIARMNEDEAARGWDIWMENGSIGTHLVSRWPGNAVKVLSRARLTASRWQHVTVSYDGSGKAEGVKIFIDGVEQAKNVISNDLTESIRTSVPLRIGRRQVQSPATDANVQDIRIYRRVLTPEELQGIAKIARRQYLIGKRERNADETEELYQWFLDTYDADHQRLVAQRDALSNEKKEIIQRGTVAHIMNEQTDMAKAYILTRGEYDKRTDEVQPDTPKILPSMRPELPKNRLGLAQWILQPENPLTARVNVNRFWQEIFGAGIVASSGDFGTTGQLPTHPELLDYLAVSFREDGWNMKNLFRLMVTSATYRQSASVSQEKLALDPTNKFLARGPRFRMDAEMIRDHALSASGLLVSKIGGPSVKPYQPSGVWEAVAMPESNTRKYVQDSGEGLYRRSLYTFLKRAAPPPNMEVFNATAREVCTIKRERTNTPLQALTTLNDVQFVEAARILAEKTLVQLPDANDPVARMQSIALKLMGRPFRGEELGVVQASLNELLAGYRGNIEAAKELLAMGATRSSDQLDPAELAAWTMTVNMLMNLDEVLTK
ncbi:MAG: DUF1553 domain-containing protein [Planctomycetota bacterium]